MKPYKLLFKINRLIADKNKGVDLDSSIDKFIKLKQIQPYKLDVFDVKIIAYLWSEILKTSRRYTDLFDILGKVINSKSVQIEYLENIITLLKKEVLYSSTKEVIIKKHGFNRVNASVTYKKRELIDSDLEFHWDFLQLILDEKDEIKLDVNIPYENNKEFLDDWFSYLDELQIFTNNNFHDRRKNKRLENYEVKEYLRVVDLKKRLETRLSKTEQILPFNDLVEEYQLDEKESIILMYLVKTEMEGYFCRIDDIIKLISMDYHETYTNKQYVSSEANLVRNNLIEIPENTFFLSQTNDVKVSPEILRRIIHKTPVNDEERLKQILRGNDMFTLIRPSQTFDQLILPKEIKKTIKTSLMQYKKSVNSILQSWGLFDENTETVGVQGKSEPGMLMLFYGKPGTGKTFTAGVIANSLGRDLLVTDISRIKSKWVGDSEKNIRKLFATYERIVRRVEKPPVLLLNEADQFLAKRITNSQSSVDNMLNSMQNLLLEAFEKLKGFLIATTNLHNNFDEAFSRRFHLKLELPIPTASERLELWKTQLPDKIPGYKDIAFDELAKNYTLTGGQIKVVIRNACTEAASRNIPLLTQSDLVKFCLLEDSSAFDKNNRRIIGF